MCWYCEETLYDKTIEEKDEDRYYKLNPNFAFTTHDLDEHILSLSVEDIRAILALHHENIDISEEDMPSKMIKICINTLNLDHMTPEEQSLRCFTERS